MKNDDKNEPEFGKLKKSLVDLANESWRFAKVFDRMIARLDAGEQQRYISQFKIWGKKLSTRNTQGATPSCSIFP